MFRLSIFVVFVALSTSGFCEDKPLLACGSDSEQPPFSFFERKDSTKTTQVRGLTIDILKSLESKLGQKVNVELLPWKRCLAGLTDGKFDLLIDDRPVQTNANTLLYSKEYFQLHPIYAFALAAKGADFDVSRPGVLAQQKVCGFPGKQYDAFGIKASQVEYGSSSYKYTFEKLKIGNCDLIVEYREVIAGLFLVDPLMAAVIKDKSFVIRPLQNTKPIGLVFSLPKMSTVLLSKLNAGLTDMIKKDQINTLLEPYF
jgi:polar amino acid transport system substrate-binding protein